MLTGCNFFRVRRKSVWAPRLRGKALNFFVWLESNGDRVRNGLLAVIDVDKATKGMGQASIITIIAAGCSPVRAVETADGQYVWVAARGRNTQLPLPLDADARGSQVLGFNR